MRAIPVLTKEQLERLATVYHAERHVTRPGLIGVAVGPQREELERAESSGFFKGFFVGIGCCILWLALFYTITRI